MGMFDKYTEDFAGNNRVKEIEEESRFIDEPIYRGATVTHTFVVPAKATEESGTITYSVWDYCHIYYVQSTKRIFDLDCASSGVLDETDHTVTYTVVLDPDQTDDFKAGLPNDWVSIQVVVKPSIASDTDVQVSNIFLAKVVDSLHVIPDEEYTNDINE